jgi:hypothetical protein
LIKTICHLSSILLVNQIAEKKWIFEKIKVLIPNLTKTDFDNAINICNEYGGVTGQTETACYQTSSTIRKQYTFNELSKLIHKL